MAKGSTGPKRTKIQREYDLKETASLYLQGQPQHYISDHLAKNRPYKVSQQVISRDLKEIQKRWLKSSLVDFNEARAQSLAKIDHLEQTYWAQFFESKGPTVKRKTAKRVDGRTTEATQEVSLGTGNPQFLKGVEWCVDRRIKLLGLDAPTKNLVSVKDWRETLPAGVDANQVENQFLEMMSQSMAPLDDTPPDTT